MKKLFLIFLLAHLLSSCSKVESLSSEIKPPEVISTQDHKALLKQNAAEQDKINIVKANDMIAIADDGQFMALTEQIKALGGIVIFSDAKTSYVNFSLSSASTLSILDSGVFLKLSIDKKVEAELKLDVQLDPNGSVSSAVSRTETPQDLYPTHLMKVDSLQEEFETRYDTKLDGSSATIIIADTGLDISRTDAFQDRIVELHTLRQSDHALLFDAETIEKDGKEFYHVSYQGIDIDIEKSDKLSGATEAYIGLFAEAQFKNPRGYNTYDFNQDGKDTGIFPVVVIKKENSPYEAYINVNTSLMYGADYGDNSIEDENVLIDFNWVAKNLKDRYVSHKSNPLKSYYKYTTRTDIIFEGALVTDRNKGVMNIAITLGVGNELDVDGKLKPIAQLPTGGNVYMMGLTGFDIMGHGTHCAGIAAGNFETAQEFSSAAPNAKIIGLTYLGAQVSNGAFFNRILKISQDHKNSVFSFSFGGNIAINDTQNESAMLFDRVSQVYSTVFVKAAGNEGPALNTHGITISKNMIAVANYYSTDSRGTYSHGNFEDGQYFLETTSSRGPMIDGALKPDIGAPGWVMSSVPLAKSLGSKKNGSFQYWPGTSMAAPNVAGVVALLYDAAEKSGQGNSEGPSVSVDKIQRALWNSALPYSILRGAECRAKQDGSLASKCNLKESKYEYQWVEGGAGRINALGAWNVLENLLDEKPQFFTVETASVLNNYRGKAAGYFNIIKDEIPKHIDFKVSLDASGGQEGLDSLAMHEKFRLQIPANIDWLSFDVNSVKKEKLVDVFGGEIVNLRVFVNRTKLMKNGRIKAGMHSAVIKAFGVDNKDLFKFMIPITMIGYDTQFDPNIDNYQLSAKGFVQGGQFARYFLPITSENEALVIDLGVDGTMPGDVSLVVFHDGMQITQKPMWTLSNPVYGQGRNNTHFVVKGKPGLYEIILKADAGALFSYKDLTGSFYNLTVSRMALKVQDVVKESSGKDFKVTLKGVNNPGGTLRIAAAGVVMKKMHMSDSIDIAQQENIDVTIILEERFQAMEIKTSYMGTTKEVDIDTQLLNAKGEVVAESGNKDSTELMQAALPAGVYTLRVAGYSIPGGEKIQINYSISKILKQPLVLADKFVGPAELVLAKGKRIFHNQEFDAVASFTMDQVDKASDLEGYTAVLSAEVVGMDGNGPADASTVFSQEL